MDEQKATVRIQRRTTDDKYVNVYYSRTLLTNMQVEIGTKGIINDMIGPISPPTENPLISAFLDIPGIETVQLMPYAATIRRAPSFEWDEIEPHIKRLLASLQLPIENVNVEEKENKPNGEEN